MKTLVLLTMLALVSAMALAGSSMRERTYAARTAQERSDDAVLEGPSARPSPPARDPLADIKAGGAAASRDAKRLLRRARKSLLGFSPLRAPGAGAPSRR